MTKYDLRLKEIEASDYISHVAFIPKVSYDSIMEHSSGTSLSIRVVDGVAMDCGGALPNNIETYLVECISVHQKGTIITLVSKPKQKEIKSIRKEEEDMSDIELYMRDLSLEGQTTRDILTAHLREAARVLSLRIKNIKFNIVDYCAEFILSVKLDYHTDALPFEETRFAQFEVTKEKDVWTVTSRIYSYDDVLKERTIEIVSVVELQTFMQLVLKEDLVLEIESDIVE